MGYVQMNKQWIKLFFAAFLEVLWVIGLAYSNDFWTWLATVVLIILSNFLMKKVSQKITAGTVLTVFVWVCGGGTVVAEILFFGEPFQWGKVLLIAMLLAGVTGLKLVTDDTSDSQTVQKRSGY